MAIAQVVEHHNLSQSPPIQPGSHFSEIFLSLLHVSVPIEYIVESLHRNQKSQSISGQPTMNTSPWQTHYQCTCTYIHVYMYTAPCEHTIRNTHIQATLCRPQCQHLVEGCPCPERQGHTAGGWAGTCPIAPQVDRS